MLMLRLSPLFAEGIILDMAGIFYLLGFISLVLAPFTGVTVVTAAAFFIIGWICDGISG